MNFKEDRDVWDGFAARSPQRSIFVLSRFLDSLSVNYDLVTCYDGDKIVAGTVIIYSDSGKPMTSVYPFTQYQGILLAEGPTAQVHSRITREFRITAHVIAEIARHYGSFCLCQSWRFRDLRPFQWHNYHEPEKGVCRLDLRYTGIVNLKNYDGFENYLASIRTVRRQEFRKASQTLKLQILNDEEVLDDLHAKTFKRQDMDRDARNSLLVKSICKHALAHGYGHMSCVMADGTPVSAVLFLYDDRTAYYLFGANDPAYRHTFAGTFLLLSMIQDAFERGLDEIDFVGVNSPNRGDYKTSFNAELNPYVITTFGVQ